MTFSELISHNKAEVRNNSNLTLYFKEAYKTIFGSYPSCSSCSINNEFQKLITSIKNSELAHQEIILNSKINTMADNSKTFVLSPLFNDYMLSYTGKDKLVRRKFANKLTDEFVVEYLTNGTPEELEERKKKFKVLPEALRKEEKTNTDTVLKTKNQPKKK